MFKGLILIYLVLFDFIIFFVYYFILFLVVKSNFLYVLAFYSEGRGCSSQSVQAADRFVPAPLSGTTILQDLPRGVVAPQGKYWC